MEKTKCEDEKPACTGNPAPEGIRIGKLQEDHWRMLIAQRFIKKSKPPVSQMVLVWGFYGVGNQAGKSRLARRPLRIPRTTIIILILIPGPGLGRRSSLLIGTGGLWWAGLRAALPPGLFPGQKTTWFAR